MDTKLMIINNSKKGVICDAGKTGKKETTNADAK